MLREIADNLTLTEDDYFVDKSDSLVFTYLKKDDVEFKSYIIIIRTKIREWIQ